jgi:hypothetical protein
VKIRETIHPRKCFVGFVQLGVVVVAESQVCFGYSSSNTVTWQVTSFSCSIIVERSDMSVSIIYSINRLIHCIRHSIKELVFFRHGISRLFRTGLHNNGHTP